MHFGEDVRKTAGNFWRIIKGNDFSGIPFKKFELSNAPSYNYTEN